MLYGIQRVLEKIKWHHILQWVLTIDNSQQTSLRGTEFSAPGPLIVPLLCLKGEGGPCPQRASPPYLNLPKSPAGTPSPHIFVSLEGGWMKLQAGSLWLWPYPQLG